MSHQDDLDNHANQLNLEYEAYWESRGYDGTPDDYDYCYDDNDEGVTDEKTVQVDVTSVIPEPTKKPKKTPTRKNKKESNGKSPPMSSFDYLLKVGEVKRRKREALRRFSPWYNGDE